MVHGKGSLLGRCPATTGSGSPTLRAYYGFMWGYPGKKLLFMGQEFGQSGEWNFAGELDWHLLDHRAAPRRAGAGARPQPPLPRRMPRCMRATASREGFRWLVVDDAAQSVFAWLRFGAPGDAAGRASSATSRRCRATDYRIGLPHAGRWREILNTDADGLRRLGPGQSRERSMAERGRRARPARFGACDVAAAGDARSAVWLTPDATDASMAPSAKARGGRR